MRPRRIRSRARSAAPGPLACVLALALLSSAACGSSDREPPADPDSIVVGSFDFTESRVLARVYASALTAAGYEVELLPSVGTREIMEPALEQGQVDLVPEYQGTALTFISFGNVDVPADPRAAHQMLVERFAERGIVPLDFAHAVNKNEVVVTRELAVQHDLRMISDLRSLAPELIFGGPPESPSRPLCLVGLEAEYDLSFADFVPLDPGGPLTVAALDAGEVDVALLFSTNPAIGLEGFVALEDDRRLQPPENVVPVVREEVLGTHGPGIEEVIDAVTAKLTTTALREFNAAVDLDGRSASDVATEWLNSEGLT
ncbi:MAG TPA: ABC transporter substrate-binding protein [Actinomycetota bacterium]|nr:ABC transporter substrate-binding protein [Actinomycetota bacterium]